MARRAGFSPPIHYVGKRPRRDWLDLDDESLKELVLFSYGRRLMGRLGAWREGASGRPRRRRRNDGDPD